MTPGPSVDPYAYPCPVCPAGAHEHCFVERTGRELPNPHAKRVKHANDQAEAARRRARGDAEERITEPRWRRLYVACRLELEQRGDWTTLAAEQLEGLVRNMARAEHYRSEAEERPLVEGSTGQLKEHPGAAAALRFDAQALITARSLKLTPDTRGTSAPRPGDEDVPDVGDDDGGEDLDELARLDEVARKRKEKAAGAGGRSSRRRGG